MQFFTAIKSNALRIYRDLFPSGSDAITTDIELENCNIINACPKLEDSTPFAEAPSDKTNEYFARQDIALNLLWRFLNQKESHSSNITPLEDNYFLIDQIIIEPNFAPYKFTLTEFVDAIHADEKLRFSVRGSKVRLKPPELNKDRSTIVSKKLAWILRHGAARHNMEYQQGGFLNLDEVLVLEAFEGITEAEIRDVINCNEKRRFEIREAGDGQPKMIRAVQGHSVEIQGLDLSLIRDASQFPCVLHGTYVRNWASIKTSGLSRMSRTHIHFAPGHWGERGVISGMRSSCEVFIYIDLEAAMRDGIKFYTSVNNVILTEGNDKGMLPAKYFKSVILSSTGEELLT